MKPLQIPVFTVHDELCNTDMMSIPAELINMYTEWNIYFSILGDTPTRGTDFVEKNMYNLEYNDASFNEVLDAIMHIPQDTSIKTIEDTRKILFNAFKNRLVSTPEIPRIHFCSCVYIKKNIDYRYSFIYTLNRLTGTITKHKVDMLFYKNYADAHDKNREFYYISDTTNSYVHSCDIDVDDNIYSFLKNVYSYYFSSLVNFLL